MKVFAFLAKNMLIKRIDACKILSPKSVIFSIIYVENVDEKKKIHYPSLPMDSCHQSIKQALEKDPKEMTMQRCNNY